MDSIQLVYTNRVGRRHGGGGRLDTFRLAPDEYIVQVYGKYGAFIDSLTIVTNKNQHKTWGGNGGAAKFAYTAPNGGKIVIGFKSQLGGGSF
ncbi:hypothetical protein KFU94_01490 [Chloroflexi bacterium TSY]|nr:hypothetical protein [Chloroflexi bacterium TSY]